MRFRSFGRLRWKVSALGFGAMRLPVIGGDPGEIDQPEAIRMMRYAIDNGVNYVDTAYPYHRGKSEALVGKVLENGYGEKVRLATKMPTWRVKSQRGMDKYLLEQLSRLQTNQVSFYLLHGLNRKEWRRLKELNVLDWAEKKIGDGKFEHLGFSFHDDYPAFREIVDDYNGWTLCQIQYNYMDADYQAGTKGLRYAASRGLAVVVMEPIAGGRLAINPPGEIRARWDKEPRRKPAEWALQWVWNHPEVSVALSGMSTMQQVAENVRSANRSSPNSLSLKELKLIDRVKHLYKKLGFVGCTNCQYCMPCPEGVNIPQILALYNEYYTANRSVKVKKRYRESVTAETMASRCVGCGNCEELCPQSLSIPEVLRKAKAIFE